MLKASLMGQYNYTDTHTLSLSLSLAPYSYKHKAASNQNQPKRINQLRRTHKQARTHIPACMQPRRPENQSAFCCCQPTMPHEHTIIMEIQDSS